MESKVRVFIKGYILNTQKTDASIAEMQMYINFKIQILQHRKKEIFPQTLNYIEINVTRNLLVWSKT